MAWDRIRDQECGTRTYFAESGEGFFPKPYLSDFDERFMPKLGNLGARLHVAERMLDRLAEGQNERNEAPTDEELFSLAGLVSSIGYDFERLRYDFAEFVSDAGAVPGFHGGDQEAFDHLRGLVTDGRRPALVALATAVHTLLALPDRAAFVRLSARFTTEQRREFRKALAAEIAAQLAPPPREADAPAAEQPAGERPAEQRYQTADQRPLEPASAGLDEHARGAIYLGQDEPVRGAIRLQTDLASEQPGAHAARGAGVRTRTIKTRPTEG